ncbi:MAG: CDP-alcohol phosphatidyltransferase family protein [Desulfobacula sp.]|uniref:CDP-alcohol phosphatidyltransferase family protein n=1 Tax=Desulfobacula sp. TaxID=2593537 RepID=UPI001D2C83A6|nr:CDP-alcohol phosphatidyltransferase family protein [Desulfobacula sp.]MBT3485882.1 CDP-alcohol phosphatidyltransferase family protein [Desulfobacula sp.]MBT3805485.1 CDP-alcohol phosphatidyltransferase family protein [Desulfobacula sp.]MBT4026800.1 CDP-alcohol phosphatidyltransferase family protein [Desulfobacula sp.]MBT4199596.1 CDP-alcohol phosphatidyltransferase family protein [Desulfobacula sp.]
MDNPKLYTIEQVEDTLQLKTWWAIWGVLPIANRIVVLIVNHTKISPNTVSIIAFCFRIISGISFLKGDWSFDIAGASFYYFAYTLDCIDGPVARLTEKSSEFGRYLDHLSDLTGDLFILCCLAFGQGQFFSIIIISMCVMHIFEAYISYLAGLIVKDRMPDTNSIGNKFWGILKLYQNYRMFFLKKNIKSFISFPDYELFVFIVFPVIGIPLKGIMIGFFMLVCVVLYSVFSTFWAIYSGDGKFP